jgi:hypothetical protein
VLTANCYFLTEVCALRKVHVVSSSRAFNSNVPARLQAPAAHQQGSPRRSASGAVGQGATNPSAGGAAQQSWRQRTRMSFGMASRCRIPMPAESRHDFRSGWNSCRAAGAQLDYGRLLTAPLCSAVGYPVVAPIRRSEPRGGKNRRSRTWALVPACVKYILSFAKLPFLTDRQ